jgi:hypothetical protein
VKRGPWKPRCCGSCGEPLETYKYPLLVDAYVPCLPCGRLWHVPVDDDGAMDLEPVLLSLEAPELQRAFDELVESWFALQRQREDVPAQQLRAVA